MTQIMVYPTSKNAMVMKHPISGPLLAGGSLWEEDGVTARALMEGAITTVKSAGFHDESIAVDTSKPPAHATNVAVETEQPDVTKRADTTHSGHDPSGPQGPKGSEKKT